MLQEHPSPAAAPLVDGQGRRIVYLRLSLTDRCNFRCSYCSPAAPETHEDPLDRDEVARLVRIFGGLGIRRVRLTGGEPTLRRDVLDVIREVARAPGIEEVALTTNGHLLQALAGPLREAGVTRLNVSLDTLDPEKLHRIAGRAATLERIVAGIEAAYRAGFASVKLNVVVVRGQNDDELGALARFAWGFGATARFIELMPFGPGKPVPTAEVKRLLEAQGVRLEPDATRGWGPAYHMRGTSEHAGRTVTGLVGFIGAMTENFCDGCNRVRVGADGSLRACLGGRERLGLKELLRGGAGDAEIAAAIRAALLGKGERHDMERGGDGLLPMIGTGG
ncbi:GTP 3',8-cyclase MoaA [Anaeromyxobacter sp. PSR-1]|uniref:GTP 3',8-cyclase MoaA n=1 Tax=Anaeromyxobacter sp. PSR-1 TaxID=1300915 RepID=UPI0005E34C63|nr:GTP 3',8-cyclase MoaA [Anaeromyxobacter sp. PSR-1]GAO02783.1 cyclic pyranopterin monophosphate synthase [Anaeromyxobacter sp. PSR-1]